MKISHKILWISCLVFIAILGLANKAISQKISYDPERGWKIDQRILLSSFELELNRLRDSFKLTNVVLSDSCALLADLQTSYISQSGDFSHVSKGLDFPERVSQKFPKARNSFAELLLKIPTDPPNKISFKVKKEIIDSLTRYRGFDFSWDQDRVDYNYLSTRFLRNWLNSPAHREILLRNGWRKFSLKSQQSSDGKYLYATLVFSS